MGEELNDLAGTDLSKIPAEQAKAWQEWILQDRKLAYKDLPARRAYEMQVREHNLKKWTIVALGAAAVVVGGAAILTARSDEERTRRLDGMEKLILGALAGAGGNAALGRQWTGKKDHEDRVRDKEDEDKGAG